MHQTSTRGEKRRGARALAKAINPPQYNATHFDGPRKFRRHMAKITRSLKN